MKKKELVEPVAKIRSVIKNGNSFYIALPQEFVRVNGIQKGDRVPILSKGSIVKIVCMGDE